MSRGGVHISDIPLYRYFFINLLSRLALLTEIVKIKITVLVSLTTALGYFLGVSRLSPGVLFPVIGIFILACGSAALNQYQERNEDALMDRTKNRPVPAGKIKANSVLLISLILLLIGSGILILKTNLTTLFIGLLAFFWYNGIYTPLKKKMIFAIIPGSVVGALPPLAGWATTGNSVFDFNILYVSFYFFVWQIPHFWLLLLIYGKDYNKGGFPVLTNKLLEKTLVNITSVLLVITIFIAACLPMLSVIHYSITAYILWFFCLVLFVMAIRFLTSDYSNRRILRMFLSINVFTLLIITLFSIDKIIYLKF